MWTLLRRLLGVLVLVLTVFPVFRVLAGRPTGPWGAATILQAETSLAVAVWGVGISVLVGIVGAVLWGERGVSRSRPRSWETIGGSHFPLYCALLAAALAVLVSRVILDGLLTNVDEMAMLVHARYWAGGHWGGPVGEGAAHWLIPNMLVVDGSWISQYPPGHVALLALGSVLGAPWIVGVLLAGVTAGCGGAAFLRFFPKRPGAARLMGGALAASPLLVLFGGGLMSHLSALAFVTVSVWAALRARSGGAGWAVLSGAALGWAVTSRPWSGLLLGVLPLLVWWGMEAARLRARVALWVTGGLPFAAVFALYNRMTFGGVSRLGYEVTYGEGHRLGFHVDPWGYPYGPIEAVGYTSADLVAFGLQALESPIPLTLLGGVFLVAAARLERAERVLVAWALLPVLGVFLYWFHQPRLLFESLPGWIGLAVLGALWVVSPLRGRFRTTAVGALLTSVLLGLCFFAPQRLLNYRWSDEAKARLVPPVVETTEPALVFVHAGWNERLASRLQAAGMRPDSLNPLLRRNDACDVQRYLESREGGDGTPLPPLDQAFVPGTPEHLQRSPSGPGLSLLRDPSRPWAEGCVREAAADRFGAVAYAPLLWQGDLPGLEGTRGVMYVRDLGPDVNAPLLTRFSGRTPWVLTPTEGMPWPTLLPYREGMALLWGTP